MKHLLQVLEAIGFRDGRWLDIQSEKTHGELLDLLGRLQDTSQEEWELRSALSWLSPLDVHEIRSGVANASVTTSAVGCALTESDIDALHSLATFLETYIATGELGGSAPFPPRDSGCML